MKILAGHAGQKQTLICGCLSGDIARVFLRLSGERRKSFCSFAERLQTAITSLALDFQGTGLEAGEPIKTVPSHHKRRQPSPNP